MDIRLDGIGHSYDDFEVLRGIDLEIPSGQIVCIVGPSGCGKSTLLRFIGGLERPQAGQVLQIGAPPDDCLNPLTYIFQDFALLPWRSVSGNISLVLEDHGIRGDTARALIEDVLARTKLSDFATVGICQNSMWFYFLTKVVFSALYIYRSSQQCRKIFAWKL